MRVLLFIGMCLCFSTETLAQEENESAPSVTPNSVIDQSLQSSAQESVLFTPDSNELSAENAPSVANQGTPQTTNQMATQIQSALPMQAVQVYPCQQTGYVYYGNSFNRSSAMFPQRNGYLNRTGFLNQGYTVPQYQGYQYYYAPQRPILRGGLLNRFRR